MKSIKDYLLILEAEPMPQADVGADAGAPPVDAGAGAPPPDAGMGAPTDPNAPPDPNAPVDPNAPPPDMGGGAPPPDMGGMGGGGGGMGGAPGQPGAVDPQATEVIKQKLKENPFWRDIIKKGTGFDTIKMGREFSKEVKLANKKRGV